MDWTEKELLRTERLYIVDNLCDTSLILDHLYADGILTSNVMDDILVKQTRHTRIETLVDLLPRLGPDALQRFLTALDVTGSEFLATYLRGKLAELRLKMPVEEQQGHDWLYERLDQHTRCRRVSEIELSRISRQLSPSVLFSLGVELGFTRSRLEQYQSDDPHAVATQLFNMLCDWLAREGGAASVVSFVEHSRAAGVEDDVVKAVILGDERNCRADNAAGVVV